MDVIWLEQLLMLSFFIIEFILQDVVDFLMHSVPKSGKGTKSQMRITDSPWPEFFREITLR